MDLPIFHHLPPWNFQFTNNPLLFPYHFSTPQNYVHWRQTPDSHIYSADLPGVRKEEIRVEVEDSKYLVIRTEAAAAGELPESESSSSVKSFMRKFRLPAMVVIDSISAGYENGVLTVRVPRSSVRRGLFIDPNELPQQLEGVARAA